MKKLLLLLLFGILVVLTVPTLRQRAQPVLGPVGVVLAREFHERVRDPLYRTATLNEARALARTLAEREHAGYALPTAATFRHYMAERNINGAPNHDRWGSTFSLVVRRDSILVVSAGPDRKPGTEDDLYGAYPRLGHGT